MYPISFVPSIQMLQVFLITDAKQLYKVERFKRMELPPTDNAIAKTCHMMNPETEEEIIVIIYPNLLTDEPVEVFSTLVHEAVHAWDYIKSVYGYDHDLEMNAYAIESIFKNLFNAYAEYKRKKDKKDAKRA